MLLKLERLPDWQLRLEAFIAERQSMPFEWGRNDCVCFAAAGVQAITGINALASISRWRSAKEALRRLKRSPLDVRVSELLGAPARPLMAAVGDVVLIRGADGRELLGLCAGSAVLAPGRHGLQAQGLGVALMCWKVG